MIEDAQNQRWYYREDGVIYPQTNPNLVLDIRVSIHIYMSQYYSTIFFYKPLYYRAIGRNLVQLYYFTSENMKTI